MVVTGVVATHQWQSKSSVSLLPKPSKFDQGRSRQRAPLWRWAREAASCKGPSSPAAASNGSPAPADASVEYKDSLADVGFIALCRVAYGNLAGWQSSRSWTDGKETFAGMVEVSRALMKGKTADQQRDAVISGFPEVPPWFRKAFPYSKWGAEVNAKITPAFFTWLVGPMETIEVEVNGVVQRSGVQIKRCRYLAESGCTAMCVNLCKAPTQTFFTRELGMPLTMEPNFEDLSCKMIFGQAPPQLSEDPVSKQSCLASCPTGRIAPDRAACTALLMSTVLADQTFTFEEEVTAVALCMPFTVLFIPTDGNATRVTITDNIADMVSISHSGQGMLSLSLPKDALTDGPTVRDVVKVTVHVPAAPLNLSLGLTSTSKAFLAPGFSPARLLAWLDGEALLDATDITVPDVQVTTQGSASVVLGGDLGSVQLRASGASSVHISGAQESVQLALADASSAAIYPSSPLVPIGGTTTGVSHQVYSHGVCSVNSLNPLTSSACVKVQPAPMPEAPLWTCGVPAAMGEATYRTCALIQATLSQPGSSGLFDQAAGSAASPANQGSGVPVGSGVSGGPASSSSGGSSDGSSLFRSTAAGGNDWWSQLDDRIAAGLGPATIGDSGAGPAVAEGGSAGAGVEAGGPSGEVQRVGADPATDLVASSIIIANVEQGAGEDSGPESAGGSASDIVASVLEAANAALAERAKSVGDKIGGRKLLQSIQDTTGACLTDHAELDITF